jgi:hypothetical protein
MLVKITEADGTKRYMNGAIESLNIDLEIKTLYMKVTGITKDFIFSIKGNVDISECEVL